MTLFSKKQECCGSFDFKETLTAWICKICGKNQGKCGARVWSFEGYKMVSFKKSKSKTSIRQNGFKKRIDIRDGYKISETINNSGKRIQYCETKITKHN